MRSTISIRSGHLAKQHTLPSIYRRILPRQINAHVHTGYELLEGGIHVADDFHPTEDTGNEHSDGLALNSMASLGGDERILSVYRFGEEDRVYIETVADRSYTTIYLPEVY